jgi:hypothetical protein
MQAAGGVNDAFVTLEVAEPFSKFDYQGIIAHRRLGEPGTHHAR